MRCTSAFLIATLMLAADGWGQSPEPVLIDMTSVRHKPGEVTAKNNAKAPAGTVDLVDGQFGKACRFSFIESTGPQMFTAWVNPKDDWDQFDGFSFWVKGDGSKSCGGLELIDGDNFGLRCGYCFPINSTKWVKVNVAWSDLIPELSGPLVNPNGGYAPSRFRNFWVGKWYYWREWPACSYTIERVILEKKIPRDAADYTPKQSGTSRVLAKLKAKQPITMVTMGDSLSDKRHWSNREKLWSEILAKRLKDAYGSEVTLVNPAIGGTTLSQNVILVPRWLQEAPSPDLVLIWFGGNDWDSGVRGPRYKQYLQTAVDRVRRLTKGQADVLVMTTLPGLRTWETTAELSKAAYAVAKERNAGFADAAGAFHKAGSAEEAMKRQYWGWDGVHLGPAGHELIAETVLRSLQSEGLADLKTAADAYWMKIWVQDVAEGETPLCSFEPGQDVLVANSGGEVVQEHATDGRHALRVRSRGKETSTISLEEGRSLGLTRDNARFLVNVFNPQQKDVTLNVLIRDDKSKDYFTRYNGSVTVKPGKNTIDLDYTRLPRTATEKSDKPDYLNPKQLTLLVLFLDAHGSGTPVTLFFDNVRLAAKKAQPKP